MIGNDVVDLELARTESNWKRKGFLQKLFTETEQALIQQHHDPETMVWLLWSMKEAAYKIYNRLTGIRAFIPHKLECSITSDKDNVITGKVILGQFCYFTKTTIHDCIIHTVASAEKNEVIEIQLSEIKKGQSGLPYVLRGGKEFPASLSHHGRAVKAVALNKTPA